MTTDTTREALRAELDRLDGELEELRRVLGGLATGADRDSAEIATDLTSREEQEAILALLERRREAVFQQVSRLAD